MGVAKLPRSILAMSAAKRAQRARATAQSKKSMSALNELAPIRAH